MASSGITADTLAGMLYDSLHQKLLPLPDKTLMYPAHGAGSMCSRNLSTDTVSPLGVQRRYNYALQPMSKADFIRLVTADQPEVPAYFAYDAQLNRRERPTLDQALAHELNSLTLDEVLRLLQTGAQRLDRSLPSCVRVNLCVPSLPGAWHVLSRREESRTAPCWSPLSRRIVLWTWPSGYRRPKRRWRRWRGRAERLAARYT
jgi:hypothetical protein